VYTRALAREWSLGGHEVTVVCQERNPGEYDLAGAAVVRPELPGGLLPVFVLDRYEGLEPRLLQDFTPVERTAYVEANVAALRDLGPAGLVFTNHVLMGGAVGARLGRPFRVNAHGSELEYSMRGRPELERWGRDCLREAEATYVGSGHIRRVVAEVTGVVDRVVEVPPGVDIDRFRPQDPAEALADLVAEARADPPNPGNREERLPDEGNAERLEGFLAGDEPTVVYFGKLIENKGVHLLLEALEGIDARAVIVGFGDFREELERRARGRVLFTGPFEHRHLVHLLPLADAAVVPSIFPEAFGMVAAEAAACGCPPLVARHSGLGEIAEGLEEEYPPHLRHLAAFEPGEVGDLRARLIALIALPAEDRAAIRAAARRAVVARWSWAGVAARLLAPVA
jgi:glycosyltransferase involved in cell wall biosynthesis